MTRLIRSPLHVFVCLAFFLRVCSLSKITPRTDSLCTTKQTRLLQCLFSIHYEEVWVG